VGAKVGTVLTLGTEVGKGEGATEGIALALTVGDMEAEGRIVGIVLGAEDHSEG